MSQPSRIFLAGHKGLLGSAFFRRLNTQPETELLTIDKTGLDLRNALAVQSYFDSHRPDTVILCAARVGGIGINPLKPVEFLTDNLKIQLNTMQAAGRSGVKSFVYYGSSCMYPKHCKQPMAEEDLLSGKPEETSLAYAMAKLLGMELCHAYNKESAGTRFLPLVSTNMYGPNDNFDLKSSHVIPALIRRFHEAKEKGLRSVTLWGTGKAIRDFIYVDDVVDATLYLLAKEDTLPTGAINIATGIGVSIEELADIVANSVGFDGHILFDMKETDGAPAKVFNVQRMADLGWKASTSLRDGIAEMYRSYLLAQENIAPAIPLRKVPERVPARPY